MSFQIEIEGPADQVFKTKVVGVTFNNSDGVNRQEILKNCKRHEELILERDYENEHDIYAIRVLTKSSNQIGFVPSDKRLAHHIDMGAEIRATIIKITGGKSLIDKLFGNKGKKLGCVIEIRKGGFNEKTIKEAERFREINKKIGDKVRKASSIEKEKPIEAINKYKEAIEDIKKLDSYGYLAKANRFERIPINRLTLLLERNKEFSEALKYLTCYQLYKDYKGLKKADEISIEKRFERLMKKKK